MMCLCDMMYIYMHKYVFAKHFTWKKINIASRILESIFESLKDFNDLEDYSGKTNPKIILNDKVHLNSEASK